MTVEVPTVTIQVSVPEHTSVQAWRWRPVDTMESTEYVFTADELQSVFVAYGAVVGLVLRGSMWHHEFRLTAHGLFTGRFLGLYELSWCSAANTFTPCDAPAIAWPKHDELPEDVRRGAVIHSQLPRTRLRAVV
ncbi:hypothetical protein [Streptomyces avermitilis]|uniref:hypothetical protein n=1 Tax=Streptomyces avermitilis TaxID=33903 RepID=UPI0037F28B5E